MMRPDGKFFPQYMTDYLFAKFALLLLHHWSKGNVLGEECSRNVIDLALDFFQSSTYAYMNNFVKFVQGRILRFFLCGCGNACSVTDALKMGVVLRRF